MAALGWLRVADRWTYDDYRSSDPATPRRWSAYTTRMMPRMTPVMVSGVPDMNLEAMKYTSHRMSARSRIDSRAESIVL